MSVGEGVLRPSGVPLLPSFGLIAKFLEARSRSIEAEAEFEDFDPQHEKCHRCRTPMWEHERIPGHGGCHGD